jgi:hypothetical protein
MSAVAEGLAEQLQCPVCLERFRDPRVLPCLHTFCSPCLGDVMASQRAADGSFPCPECRAACAAAAVGDVRRNFFAGNALELLRVHEATTTGSARPPPCGLCCGADGDVGAEGDEDDEEEELAVSRCVTCSLFLCELHDRAHRKARATRSHDVAALADLGAAAGASAPAPATGATFAAQRHCGTHRGEPLRLFCVTCDAVICRDCTIVDHKGHEYNFVEQVYTAQCAEIKTAIARAASIDAALAAAIEAVADTERSVEANATGTLEEILAIAARRIDDVRRWEQGLADEVAALRGSKGKQLAAQRGDLEAALARLRSSVAFAEDAFGAGSKVDVLSAKTLLVSRLRGIGEDAASRQLVPCHNGMVGITRDAREYEHWDAALAAVRVSGAQLHLPSSRLEPDDGGVELDSAKQLLLTLFPRDAQGQPVMLNLADNLNVAYYDALGEVVGFQPAVARPRMDVSGAWVLTTGCPPPSTATVAVRSRGEATPPVSLTRLPFAAGANLSEHRVYPSGSYVASGFGRVVVVTEDDGDDSVSDILADGGLQHVCDIDTGGSGVLGAIPIPKGTFAWTDGAVFVVDASSNVFETPWTNKSTGRQIAGACVSRDGLSVLVLTSDGTSADRAASAFFTQRIPRNAGGRNTRAPTWQVTRWALGASPGPARLSTAFQLKAKLGSHQAKVALINHSTIAFLESKVLTLARASADDLGGAWSTAQVAGALPNAHWLARCGALLACGDGAHVQLISPVHGAAAAAAKHAMPRRMGGLEPCVMMHRAPAHRMQLSTIESAALSSDALFLASPHGTIYELRASPRE